MAVNDLGTVKPGTTLYIPFHTFDSNDPSASVTISGLAVGDIQIYKDGGVTQRASTAGFTLLDTDGIDFDSLTGIHGISIDLADNTTAGFYEAGSQYWVVISSVTVDAATVSFVLATFRIGYQGALLDTTIATLASQTSFTLEEGPADNDALNGCRVIVHDLASAVQIAQAVVSDYVGSTKTVTLKADPAIFTMAAGDNVSFFPRALEPTTPGTTLDVTSAGTAGIDWGNVENAGTTVDLSATDINLVDTATDVTNQVTADTTAISGDTVAANNLELDYDGTGYNKSNSTIGTCTTNTDMRGTDNAALASVLGALTDAAAAGDPTTADTVMQYVKQLINILIGTTGVTTFPAEAAPANNVSLAEVIRAIHTDVTGLNGDSMRGTDSAALASVCTEARLAELDAGNVPTDLSNIETDTQDIQSRLPGALSGGNMKSDVLALNGQTASASNLEKSASTIIQGTVDTTVFTPTTTEFESDDITEATADHYNGRIIIFTSGVLLGQATDITDYSLVTGRAHFTVTALTEAPTNNMTFVVV